MIRQLITDLIIIAVGIAIVVMSGYAVCEIFFMGKSTAMDYLIQHVLPLVS